MEEEEEEVEQSKLTDTYEHREYNLFGKLFVEQGKKTGDGENFLFIFYYNSSAMVAQTWDFSLRTIPWVLEVIDNISFR